MARFRKLERRKATSPIILWGLWMVGWALGIQPGIELSVLFVFPLKDEFVRWTFKGFEDPKVPGSMPAFPSLSQSPSCSVFGPSFLAVGQGRVGGWNQKHS